MKVSLVLSSALNAQDLVAQAQAQLKAAGLQVEFEQVMLSAEQLSAEQLSAEQLSAEQPSAEQLSAEQPSAEQPSAEFEPSAAMFQALGRCSGEWIAVLSPGSEPASLVALLLAHRSLRDRELTAVIQETKLRGAARFRHMGHRLLCRLGGKRSPPRGDSNVLFQRRWLPALLALPVTFEWDLPLALAVLGVQWERVWTTAAPASSNSPNPRAQLSGWRRLLLVGALFELGLVGAVALYALSSVLIIMGSRSSWALKGSVGIALGVLLVLAFGTVQLFARRKLRPALALSAEVQADLVRPDAGSQPA